MKDKLIAITTLGFIFSLFFYYKVISPVDSTLTSKKIDESDPVVNFVNQIEEKEKMKAIINPIIDSLNSEDNVNCKLNIDETNELSFSEAFKYYRECDGNNSSFNWNENVYSTLLKSEVEAKAKLVQNIESSKINNFEVADKSHLQLQNQLIGDNLK
jgi:hypothetical protein